MSILLSIGQFFLSLVTVILAVIGVVRLWEDRHNPKYWQEDDEQRDKKNGLAGEYYLYYVRVKEGDRGESKFHIVQAIAKIENSRPLVWRFLGYHQTRIRILAPREREDLSNVLSSVGLGESDNGLFSLFGMQDYSERKDIFDIRGDVFFDRDRFFFQSRGVNSFEHSVHIGVTSTTGMYRIFFTISAWLDWRQKPTAAETLFVKRRFVDDALSSQLESFMSALRSLRGGDKQTFAHVLNPIFLPDVEEADKTLKMLRGTLSPNQD